MADQCRLDGTVNCVAISSSAQPNWWDHDHLHAAAAVAAAGAASHLSASSWPWHRPQQQLRRQPNPNSNSSCDEDVSMSSTSFTNASNHSSLSVDSSRRIVDQRSANSSNDELNSNIGEQVSDNHIWSQVLLSVGNNDLNSSMSHDVGENFLDALSSKNQLSNNAMYEPACDYLKKLDNAAASNWEFTSSSSATMHASNLNNFERQININGSFNSENLSSINLVSTWSIAPPEPQNSPFFNLPQASCYGSSGHHNLLKAEGANLHERPLISSDNGSNNNIDYQIGLNNAMAADNGYYGSGMPADSYSSSNGARSFTDVISFNSRLGKPLMDHIHQAAQKPSSNFKSLIKLSETTTQKKQGIHTSSPAKMSGRGQESAGKKKRTEDSSTSSETVLKKPKQETSSSSVKVQAPKVKVADKITALQQIVSPFGKTDTASVLYEAIQYIKFLQDQVHVLLSNPYMKTNQHKQLQDPWGKLDQVRGDHHARADLKSRGLCLVPTSCTPPVYRDNTGSDYWTPTYRGYLYR